jgi:uncharacterized protein
MPIQTFLLTKIMPGAFDRTLQTKRPQEVKVLYQHDSFDPIGTALELKDVPATGLYVTLQLNTEVQRIADYFALVRAGTLDALSIGFNPVRWSFLEEPGQEPVRMLEEVDLVEISLVTWGADASARITGTHSRSPYRYTTPQDRELALAEAQLAMLSLTRIHPPDLQAIDRALTDATLKAIRLQDLGTPDAYSHHLATLERRARAALLPALWRGAAELRGVDRGAPG